MNNLHFLIKKAGYTQGAFAEKVGLSRFGLANGIENETIKLRDLRKIADTLGYELGYLLNHLDSDMNYLPNSKSESFNEGQATYQTAKPSKEEQALKVEIKYLKDKVKTLEQTIKDKSEIIELLKK